jgi:cell division protein FtsB
VRSLLVGFFTGINRLLQQPQKVVWICLVLVVLNLVIDGSVFRLMGLYREDAKIRRNLELVQNQNQDIRERLHKARDPAFIERVARDRFDLVSEGDLVFVFSEEGEPK